MFNLYNSRALCCVLDFDLCHLFTEGNRLKKITEHNGSILKLPYLQAHADFTIEENN